MAYVGGAAAAAAAAKRKRLEAEEEHMVTYTSQDLQEDWEFKIVRSESGTFRKPEVLKKLCEEEARAGWVLVEKFDNQRVRFKRPRSARHRDALLPPDVDPYRTRYGAPSAQYAVLASVTVALLLLGLFAFLFWQKRGSDRAPIEWSTVSVLLGIVTLGVMALVVALRRRR